MLQDVAANLLIVRHSDKISRSRKINILKVYMEQIRLVFFEDTSTNPPLTEADKEAAKELYVAIEQTLYQLLEEEIAAQSKNERQVEIDRQLFRKK